MIVWPEMETDSATQRNGDAGDIFSLAERPHGVAASPDGTKLERCVQHARDPGRDRKLVPKLARKHQIDLNNTGSGIDHPDQQFFETTAAARNATTPAIAAQS